MFGSGVLKGLGITLQHLRDTFVDDRKDVPSRYENSVVTGENRRVMRQPGSQEGILTLQYPEEKRQLPERFRYIPMLIFDTEKNEDRCTACGICAKVCPPQCIWIVRDADENGKPVTRPAEFYIDATICMSCSFCVEFCPFDAIRMNHDYELAVFDRYPQLVYDKVELTVPLEYYAALWPTQYAEEQERRAAEDAAAAAKAEAKATADAAKKAAAVAKAAAPAGEAPVDAAAKPQRSAADIEAMKKQAQERAAAAKARAAGGAAETASAAAPMSSMGAPSGGEPAAPAGASSAAGAGAQDALREAGTDYGADAPAAQVIAAEGAGAAPAAAPADDEAAAKKARIEELKRKAQEAAAKRKEAE